MYPSRYLRCATGRLRAQPSIATEKYNVVPPRMTTAKLDVSGLKPPASTLPQDRLFVPENSGSVDLNWLSESPQFVAVLQQMRQLPPPNNFFKADSLTATDVLSAHLKYHELLQLAAEHHWMHLLPRALLADDAPLPHVVYEDFMKALTFSSKQDAPERQFALAPALIRTLLCRCAELVLADPAYFKRVQSFFMQIEQQQPASAEAYSAYVMVCLAANDVDQALEVLLFMDAHHLPFDPVVAGLTMHPGLSALDIMQREYYGKAKGLLLQHRLINAMQVDTGSAAAVGVHSAFVLYSLTNRAVKKWDVVRCAIRMSVILSPRTLHLIAESFNAEGGRYCGPQTCKALCMAFARQGRIDRVVGVILAVRRHEQRRATPALMCTAFTTAEEEALFAMCRKSNPRDTEAHASLLRAVIRDEEHNSTPQSTPRVVSERSLPRGNSSHGSDPLATVQKPHDKPVEQPETVGTHSELVTCEALPRTSKRRASRRHRRPFRAIGNASLPSIALPHEMEGQAKPPEGFVGVRAPSDDRLWAEAYLASSRSAEDADHYDAVSFKEAVAAWAAQRAELDSIRRRAPTAWMNPTLEFR